MSFNREPLVSVVTPFYNTEMYLAECIESVLAQNFGNWEYILVDNCSTDSSLDIANSYTECEPRIRLVRNETFLGQVQNYNHSLRLISPGSEYCKFIQADDWIFPDCLSEMVEIAEAYPTVGVVGSYWLRGSDLMGGGLPYPSTFMSGGDICSWQLSHHPDRHIITQPTVHLIRSCFVRSQDPFFDESILDFEDYEVWFRVFKNCDFGFCHKILTFQRVDSESISGKIRDYSPNLLSAFACLSKYGKSYMSEESYSARLQVITDRYYTALAKSLICNKDKNSILKYHEEGLSFIKCSIDRTRLTKYVLLEVLRLTFRPRLFVKIVLDHFKHLRELLFTGCKVSAE